MNNKTLYGSLFLLLLSLNVHARPMAIMHEKTFDLSSHELSIQQPSICPGDKNNETKQLNISPKHFSDTNNTGNLTCSLCQVLVNVVNNQIKHGNHTIIEITQVIKDICSMIKGPSGDTCVLVVENIQNIVEWITSNMTSNVICEKLHLCNSTLVHVI